MSREYDPTIDRQIIAAEFTAEDDVAALTALAKWLKGRDSLLDLCVIKIEHEYGDQYTPTRLTAFVMVDRD